MSLRALFLALALGLVTTPALAQTARGSLEVQRSLSVAAVHVISARPDELSASLSVVSDTGRSDAPSVVMVRGDPGRVYRIRVPDTLVSDQGVSIVEDLQIWSANTGDVSTARVSHMDLDGRDLLRITGRLRQEGSGRNGAIITALPLTIDYE